MALRGYRLPAQKVTQPVPDKVWTDPLYFIGFGLGSGAMPIAPGTFGTLFAIPIYLMLRPLPLTAYLFVVLVFCIFSMWVCEKLSQEIKIHDHPGMSIDEFAGFLVAMINAPLGWGWVLSGFILFRIFDILKPYPISWMDKNIHGGVGMVLDDIAAGFVSFLLLQLFKFILI